MLIVNLNIRGLGGSVKARYLRYIIAREDANFACIQETKVNAITDARCFNLWGDNKVGWLHYGGDNGSGSLLSLWHKEAFCYEKHVMEKGFIAVFGKHIKSNCRCVVVNVYVACSVSDKIVLWRELSDLKKASSDVVWCFCGDFNAIRENGERKGVSMRNSNTSEMRDFNIFIDANLLFEIPLVGKPFMWFNSNGKAKSRLDRVLVTEEWMQTWPMCKQYMQNREVSDHCAIVVKSVDKDWGPKPFRTIDAWLMERGFGVMVKEKWSSYVIHGNALTGLKEKLKRLKGDLKVWNRVVFGNMENTKKALLKEIETLDCQDCNGALMESERLHRIGLVSKLKETDKKLESLLCQKARASWFKNGDSCSKFFHSTLRWRRLKNEIKGVEVGGQWCEEPPTVRNEAKKMFEKRFKASRDFEVVLEGVEFKALTLEDNTSLMAEFSEKEVREAVWRCDGSKSPGPDGFNFNFIKKSWEVIKEEVMGAMAAFYASGYIPKGCNASFIALVPKVRDPVTLEQYRPISLVGAMYKIISKVLAERLKKVLPSIIDESQSAFLKDRGILDSVLLVNEAIEDLRRRGSSGLCLKVDFEKAYDSVSWAFLYDMLQKLGLIVSGLLGSEGVWKVPQSQCLLMEAPRRNLNPLEGCARVIH